MAGCMILAQYTKSELNVTIEESDLILAQPLNLNSGDFNIIAAANEEYFDQK